MDKYIDYYNDSKKVTYHEQTDISNILKLRAVLKTLPDFCKRLFSCYGSAYYYQNTNFLCV